MKTLEGYEKDDICKYLDSIGAWYFRPFMNGYGKSGVPDIIACIEGDFWGIEVKREGKGATPRQQLRMAEIDKARGHNVAGTAAVVINYINLIRATRV